MPPKRKIREDEVERAPGPDADSASPEEETEARRQPAVLSFNTLLEDTRQYHDDIERLERLICEEFRSFHGGSNGQSSPRAQRDQSKIRNTHNARLFHEYAVLDMLEQVQDKSTKLLAMYEDARGERADEVANGLKGADALSMFYGYVKSIDDYFEGDEMTLVEGYDEGCRRALKRVEPGVLEGRVRGLFSGEEGLGRYLDVEDLYKEMWCGIWDDFTSKHTEVEVGDGSAGAIVPVEDNGGGANGLADRLDNSFASYLRRLRYGHEEDLTGSYKMKNHGKYVLYLRQLVAYLSGFYTRAHPLKEWGPIEKEIREAFEKAWEGGLRARWATVVDVDDQEGWAQRFKTVAALEKGLGGEKIKLILASMGLKCGGTVRQRAERLWSVKGKALDEIEPSLFAGGSKRKGAAKAAKGIDNAARVSTTTSAAATTTNVSQNNAGNAPEDTTYKAIARLEFTVKYLCTTSSLLAKQYTSTIEKLEKRYAQTYDEFVADMDAELENDLGENVFADEDEDEEVHNPLKIPLGFDGKPIPYWMYKLHGLNHEFTCEICGNATYFGRRQFEKHFSEAKHVGGLKALGISSSREFNEITGISEALGLWNTLQAKKKAVGAAEEEVEDAEGNIMSREMLTALHMQGVFGNQ